MENSFFETLRNISFKDYAPIPFWSWNNKIEAEEARLQIRQMKEVGYGGFIIHARAGLTTEYLSEDWFTCVAACVEEAKKLDMCVWIYDEFGYPSGFVGGSLLENESNRAEYLEYKRLERFDETAFAVFVRTEKAYGRVEKSVGETTYYTVYKRRSPCNVDILNPVVVSQFIEKTHEAYYARFAEEFGKTIRGFFTDEPQYYRYATPYTSVLEEEFSKSYQENVKDGLIHLFEANEEDYPFRVKYYQALNRLYTQNYYKRLYDWCEAHECQLMGHTVEEPHLYSQMWGSAGAMPSYRYSHIAGIDHLCQAMDGVIDEVQVESVAAQFGIKQVMSESFACTGYDANFRMLKYIADYQYALGVNYLVVHLMNYSLQGRGYKDHPQTFSPHAAWWRDFKIFNDYFKKLGYIFANTRREVNVLLVHPMQDCYLTYDRVADKNSVLQTEKEFFDLSKELAEKGVAFHYADETLLREYGRAENGTLAIGEKTYGYVVLPNRKSVNKETQKLLQEYVGKGGKLCVLGKYPEYIQGEKQSFILSSTISFETLLAENRPLAECDGKVFQRHCKGEAGEFLFLLNTGEGNAECVLPRGYQVVDLERERTLSCDDTITLQPRQATLLKKGTDKSAGMMRNESERVDITKQFKVTDIDENNLLLDFAETSFDGRIYSERKHTEQILDDMIRAQRCGDLYLKYSFTVKEIPETLSLLTQNNRIKGIFVNGKEVRAAKTAYDPCFYTADVKQFCKTGNNEIVFLIDFYENPNVYYATYGNNVTESLYNMLSYDTVIEPIYLQGKFCVNEAHEIVSFALPKKLDNLQTQGFPFFNGTVTLTSNLFRTTRTKALLRLIGNYATAEILVNDKKHGVVALSDNLPIEFLSEGKNEIKIHLTSTMRNMYGPHHYKGMQEWWGISPYTFTFHKKWKDGMPEDFTESYNLAPFGLEKIEVEK